MNSAWKALACTVWISASAEAATAPVRQPLWGSMEYVYAWVKDAPVGIPLITENDNPSAFGFIGEPGTHILFGAGSSNDALHFPALTGARITLGGWLDKAMHYGIEANVFDLPFTGQRFTASSVPGNFPVINVPFNSSSENVLVNKETPNTVLLRSTFQAYGYAIQGLHAPSCTLGATFFLGLRQLSLKENFLLRDMSFPSAGVVTVEDSFSSTNHFYGVELGGKWGLQYAQFKLDMRASVALGNNHQTVDISGKTDFNQQRIQNFGLFSEPTNLGTHTNNTIALLPEWQLRLAYAWRPYLQPFMSYNGFYMNHVLRAITVLDRTINTSQNALIGGSGILSGPAVPAAQVHNSSMWVQGFGVGVQWVGR